MPGALWHLADFYKMHNLFKALLNNNVWILNPYYNQYSLQVNLVMAACLSAKKQVGKTLCSKGWLGPEEGLFLWSHSLLCVQNKGGPQSVHSKTVRWSIFKYLLALIHYRFLGEICLYHACYCFPPTRLRCSYYTYFVRSQAKSMAVRKLLPVLKVAFTWKCLGRGI